MKFQPGQRRPENAGRKKGVKNKRTIQGRSIGEILESLGIDPVEKLITETFPELEPYEQARILTELISFLHPKKKAVEHTGADAVAINVNVGQSIGELVSGNNEVIEHLLAVERIVRKATDV